MTEPWMSPRGYWEQILLPTVAEFRQEPNSMRRGFLACISVYHIVDSIAVADSCGHKEILENFTNQSKSFLKLRDVANLAKHINLDPNRSGNRGRELPKPEHVHVGRAAAFSDGTYWSDGTSWSDAPEVVRIRGKNDEPIDLMDLVENNVRMIGEYLGIPHDSLGSPSQWWDSRDNGSEGS